MIQSIRMLAFLLLLLTTIIIVSAQDISCKNCRGGNRKCIGDQLLQAIDDSDCSVCAKSGTHWKVRVTLLYYMISCVQCEVL